MLINNLSESQVEKITYQTYVLLQGGWKPIKIIDIDASDEIIRYLSSKYSYEDILWYKDGFSTSISILGFSKDFKFFDREDAYYCETGE